MIFHGRLPSEKAGSLFAVEEAHSFAKHGCDVVLIAPRRLGRSEKSITEYYAVPQNFKVVYLPTLDVFKVPFMKKIAFHISFVVFSFFTLLYLLKESKENDVIYSNESLPILLATFFRENTLYQVHDFPENKKWFYTQVLLRVRHVLIITEWKRDELVNKFGVKREHVHLVRNGVHREKYTTVLSRTEARKKLNLPLDTNIVCYTGHLYSWKGVATLAQALTATPSVLGYFVGGTPEDVSEYQSNFSSYKNIHFVGHQPHDSMPLWQKACDVLVLPNTAKEKISTHYTSPMKLFEYIASGTPVIASRIPSIEEVVTEEDVFFAHPDDPDSFRNVITYVLSHREEAEIRARNALQHSLQFDWEERAKKVLSFLFA